MISLAIPNFNQYDTVKRLIEENVNDDCIGEIVITEDVDVDEHSYWKQVEELSKQYSKVRFYKNPKRLGAYLNKHHVVELCKYNWVALCDSDNFMGRSYFDVLMQQDKWDESILYCPCHGKPNNGTDSLNFHHLQGELITNVSCLLDEEKYGLFFHMGNYFFNKKKYLEISSRFLQDVSDEKKGRIAYDSFMICQQWLREGNKILCVPKLTYEHMHRSDGAYWYYGNGWYWEFYELKRYLSKLSGKE